MARQADRTRAPPPDRRAATTARERDEHLGFCFELPVAQDLPRQFDEIQSPNHSMKLSGWTSSMIIFRRISKSRRLSRQFGCLAFSAADADQAFQRFLPLLVDLDGWQGKKPEGFSMETSGTNMITATREYDRGSAHLQDQVMTGAAAQGALAATKPGMNIETSEMRMNTSTIDGMQVTRSFNIKDKSGAILVALGDSGLFSVSFR
jgi:hypothetical protein